MTERERVLLVARIFDLLKDVIRAGILVWGGWIIYLCVKELAGKSTDASFAFAYFVSNDNDYGLPWFFAFAAIVWALLERRFRMKKTQELTIRTQELEKRLDPTRTSSGLAATGETHPRDRWTP
jgi:hypothetical protein